MRRRLNYFETLFLLILVGDKKHRWERSQLNRIVPNQYLWFFVTHIIKFPINSRLF